MAPEPFRAMRLAVKRAGPGAALLDEYFEAAGQVALNMRVAARHWPSATLALYPMATLLDQIVGRALSVKVDRGLEWEAALAVRANCQGLLATPMFLEHNPFGGFVQLLYGAIPGTVGPLTIQDPKVVGEVLLGSSGMSLREFAQEFTGPDVRRMHELMSSPQWWSEPTAQEVVERFNRESRQFGRSRVPAEMVVLVGVASSIFLGAGTGAIAAVAAALARPVLQSIAPGVVDTIDALLTSRSRESVMLARIRRRLN